MRSLTIKSPAKLNLYLNVLRKRPDGYHNIETIFEKIALFDIITIRHAKKGIGITTDNPKMPTGRNNLAYRAAKALFDRAGFKGGVRMNIEKNIPIAAGLGGGSSDAASVLSGVNRFFGLGLAKSELLEIGRGLGADVPFFLHDHTFAIGRGKGDVISPISINHDIILWHIIISFNFGVSTKKVYNSLNLGLTPGVVDVKIPARPLKRGPGGLRRFILKNDIENLAACLYNKLEEAVIDKIRVIKRMKGLLLENGAYGAVLSGSGPTLFGITRTREEAIAVKRNIEREVRGDCNILVARTLG